MYPAAGGGGGWRLPFTLSFRPLFLSLSASFPQHGIGLAEPDTKAMAMGSLLS